MEGELIMGAAVAATVFMTMFSMISQKSRAASQAAPITAPVPPDVAGGNVPQADAAKAAQKAAAITRMGSQNTILTTPLGLSSEFVTSKKLGG